MAITESEQVLPGASRVLAGALFRRRFLAVSVLSSSLLVAGAITSFQTPLYLGRASVLLENLKGKIVKDVEVGTTFLDRDEFRAQQVLANSRPVIQRAAEINNARHKRGGESAATTLSFLDEERTQTRNEGRLLILEVLHPDPVRAAELADDWLTAYVEESQRRQVSFSLITRDFLDTQLPQLLKNWTQKKQALQDFQVKTGFYPTESSTIPAIQQYPLLAQQLTNARMRLATLQAETTAWEEKRNDLPALLQAPRARRDTNLLAYESQIQQQRKKLIEMRQVFIASSQEVQKAEVALTDLETLARKAVEGLDAQIRLELRTAQEEVKGLDVLFREAERQYETMKMKMTQFSLLEFEAVLAQKQYEELSQRHQDADMAGRVQVSSATPWEKAEVPIAPFRPSWRRNMFFGLMIGLLLAGGAVLLRESLDDTVFSSGQLQASLGLNVLGTVPLLERRWWRESGYTLARDHPRATPVESLRALRSSLSISYGVNGASSMFLVTSPGEGEGKSFLASNLASLFAIAGKRTLLVDMDLYKSTLSAAFGVSGEPGLALLNQAPHSLSELVREGTVPNLYFLPAGGAVTNPSAAIESAAFQNLLEEARRRFEVVILDAPPILAVADACAVASRCDTVVLAIRSRRTRLTQVDRAVEIMQRAQAKECVCVINGLDATDAHIGGYGYGYCYKSGFGRYGYGYGYGKGYGYGAGRQDQKRQEPPADKPPPPVLRA